MAQITLITLLNLGCIFQGALAAAETQHQPLSTTVKAHSKKITIIDGDDTLAGEVAPELNPDVYVYHPTAMEKTVSYITDVDRIDFHVEPGQSYDFAVLLDDQICNQKLSPTDPLGPRYSGVHDREPAGDVIPFKLAPNNTIQIKGCLNGSQSLDLVFDTGASVGVLSDQGQAKGAKFVAGPNNRFDIDGIVIDQAPVIFIDYRGALKADGVLGYNCLVGKIVTIDYDRGVMIVRDKLPPLEDAYRKTKLVWRGAKTCVELSLNSGGQEHNALALFDTGSKWSLSLCQDDPIFQHSFDELPAIGTRRGKTASGQSVSSKVVEFPELKIAGIAMRNAQADLEFPTAKPGLSFNILGNDFLKRFNAILDYQRSEVYLKPNGLQFQPYNSAFNPTVLYWAVGAVVVSLMAGYWLVRRRTRLLGAGAAR
jgi:hypothetical protein